MSIATRSAHRAEAVTTSTTRSLKTGGRGTSSLVPSKDAAHMNSPTAALTRSRNDGSTSIPVPPLDLAIRQVEIGHRLGPLLVHP